MAVESGFTPQRHLPPDPSTRNRVGLGAWAGGGVLGPWADLIIALWGLNGLQRSRDCQTLKVTCPTAISALVLVIRTLTLLLYMVIPFCFS